MRLTTPFLGLFAALAIAVTGCSGSGAGAPGIPAANGPQIQNGPEMQTVSAPASNRIDGSRACRYRHSCPAKLIVPLTFDGRRFSVGRYASCKTVSLSDAQRYTTRRTRRLFLRQSVSLRAQCVPASKSARIFIAVAEVGRTARRPSGSIEVDSTGTRLFFIPIGNLVNTGKKWTFHAAGLGTKLNANAKYVFYVVSAPLDAVSTGNFAFIEPLNFNGGTFSAVPNSCYENDPGDAPVYTAPSSGPLTLSGTVTMTPACVPSQLPPNPPPLYIVAVNVGADSSSSGSMRPMDDNLGVNAVAVAGPVNVEDNPWNFAPDSPGLTMTAGNGYAFFIAAALPPPPPPTQSFGEVIPLNFDGSNFTVPSISSCTALPTAVPYTAPTSAPLTLAASVSITPNCVPSSSSSSSSSGSGQLYIVAAVTCNSSSSGSDSSSDSGSGSGCCQSSSSSSSSGCGSDSQNGVRPRDSGNCSTGLQGGGDNVVRLQPRDAQSNACTIYGYAIAGPVNPGDNPWIFAPLTPPLNLTAGSQYTFYVGIANEDDNSQ